MSLRRPTWIHFLTALLLSLPIRTAAIPQISLSNTPQQCTQTIITISGGTAPFTFSILVPADGASGAHFETFASTSSTSATWDGSLAAGKTSQFQVMDASRGRANTHPFTVLASDDDSCLGGSQSPPPTTTTTTTPPPPSPPPPTTASPTQVTTSDSQPDPPTSTSPSDPGTSTSPSNPGSTSRSEDNGSSPTTGTGTNTDSAPSVTSNPTSSPSDPSSPGSSDTLLPSGQTPSSISGMGTSQTDGPQSSASGSLPAPTTQSLGYPSGHSLNIGLIVGIIVAVLAVVLVALYVLYRRRRRRTSQFAIKQYPAEDPEGRSSTAHSLLLSELSPKAAMKQSLTHSFTQSSLSPSYPASVEENSSVLYLHPYAPDSIVAEPTVIDMTPRQEPTATREQSTTRDDTKHSTITSPSTSEKRSGSASPLSESLSPSSVDTPSTAPTVSLPQSTLRHHTTSPSTDYEEPRRGDERTSETQRPIVYELDGGVCLAGGPPGGARGSTQDAPGVAMTLPPPYRLY
ncbi:hypothetical protein C8Q80DRAFT_1266955 [Daedaleopsis nitida]|nr:hypothetical protein C8Q80DRAFT_1266955 [Daedaleopsis nitida]